MNIIFYIPENYSSRNLWGKNYLLTKEQIRNIEKGLEWTVNNVISAVLIGGTATIYYVSSERYLTPDLDCLVKDIVIVKTKLSLSNIFHRFE